MSAKSPTRGAAPGTGATRSSDPTTQDPAAAGAMPEAEASDAVSQTALKRRELLAQVVRRSEVKNKFAKPVLDAALDVIGAALAEGRDLNLAPMGRVKIMREIEQSGSRVLVARIRQTTGGADDRAHEDDEAAKEVVAEPQE